MIDNDNSSNGFKTPEELSSYYIKLFKAGYNADQPRDEKGQWTSGWTAGRPNVGTRFSTYEDGYKNEGTVVEHHPIDPLTFKVAWDNDEGEKWETWETLPGKVSGK